MVTNKCSSCLFFLISKMVGQGRPRSTLTASAAKNKVWRQCRRVHRWRIIISNDSDYEIIWPNVSNSIQNIFRDQRLGRGKGE